MPPSKRNAILQEAARKFEERRAAMQAQGAIEAPMKATPVHRVSVRDVVCITKERRGDGGAPMRPAGRPTEGPSQETTCLLPELGITVRPSLVRAMAQEAGDLSVTMAPGASDIATRAPVLVTHLHFREAVPCMIGTFHPEGASLEERARYPGGTGIRCGAYGRAEAFEEAAEGAKEARRTRVEPPSVPQVQQAESAETLFAREQAAARRLRGEAPGEAREVTGAEAAMRRPRVLPKVRIPEGLLGTGTEQRRRGPVV